MHDVKERRAESDKIDKILSEVEKSQQKVYDASISFTGLPEIIFCNKKYPITISGSIKPKCERIQIVTRNITNDESLNRYIHSLTKEGDFTIEEMIKIRVSGEHKLCMELYDIRDEKLAVSDIQTVEANLTFKDEIINFLQKSWIIVEPTLYVIFLIGGIISLSTEFQWSEIIVSGSLIFVVCIFLLRLILYSLKSRRSKIKL